MVPAALVFGDEVGREHRLAESNAGALLVRRPLGMQRADRRPDGRRLRRFQFAGEELALDGGGLGEGRPRRLESALPLLDLAQRRHQAGALVRAPAGPRRPRAPARPFRPR